MTLTKDTITGYRAFFETLTAENVDGFRSLATDDVRWRDPFVDVKGIDSAIAYILSWFNDLDGLHFIVKDFAVDGLIGFSDWTMKFRIRRNPRQLMEIWGVSKVTFNEKGEVIEHIDFWDSSPFFESVPVLGKAVTLIRKLYS